MLNEKIIDTITIDGVEFEIIEKAKTIYAGSYFVAPDPHSEPDTDASRQWFQDNKNKIIDSITPDCMICLSIDYALDHTIAERPYAMLHGQETNNPNQPKGVHVIEAEPTTFIKVKATEAAFTLTKKLTGLDKPQENLWQLFTLVRHIFESDKYKYEFNGCKQKGNEEAEYYYFNGDNYVSVPVKRKG